MVTQRRTLPLLSLLVLLSSPVLAQSDAPPAARGKGRLYTLDGYRILELSGTPEEMGEAHGRLLRSDIRRVIRDVLEPDENRERYARIIAASRIMERYQPQPFRREMRSLARAAGVRYDDVVALQLFGDAERGAMPGNDGALPRLPDRAPEGYYQCTNYAVFGPATRTGECIVGRNFDYWYTDVARYASVIIYYRPENARRFVTISWAGIINGWTMMNDAGLCAANNSAYSLNESLTGISTCFLQRLVIQNAATVKEAVAIVRKGPRAVGTVMLVAGGKPPDAVEIEFDHGDLVVRRSHRGSVMAANGFRALGITAAPAPDEDAYGRYGTLLRLIQEHHGRIDRTMNFAAARGVPLASINLHSALLFPADLSFAVSMGHVPACEGRFRRFRMTGRGIVTAK